MIKTIGIVSLSRGILGEDFMRHELEIGEARLKAYGLNVKYMPNARRGLEYLGAHPEARAADLLAAYCDPEVDMILCAIGGDDTYRLAPYLFDNSQLKRVVTHKPFLGFSDTTVNHFMLNKLGVPTFYGQAFLPDVCELDREMLPYTRSYFEELISTGHIREVHPSDIWYESRSDFGPNQVGTALPAHPNSDFNLLQGSARFQGKILGGCIDTMYDFFNGERHADMPDICRKYGLFPSIEAWRGKVLLLESSEEQMPPEKYRRALEYLKRSGVFSAVSGVLVGKPMDEKYHDEYRRLLVRVIDNPSLPVVCNINIGHALPRCIIPFGVDAVVDAQQQLICFDEPGWNQ